MVEIYDKTWSTGERNGKSLQYSCLENPMDSMKRQKDRTLKDELPRSVGAQYATGEGWRNNSRKNEVMDKKQKQHPVVGVAGDGSKVQCCREQYCIDSGQTRDGKSGILGISKLKWTGKSDFSSDDHYIYYCRQESLRRYEVATIGNKRV